MGLNIRMFLLIVLLVVLCYLVVWLSGEFKYWFEGL